MPLLSIVVTITDGDSHVDRCLHALSTQDGAPPLEIIVPLYEGVDDAPGLRARWPGVRFVTVEGHRPAAHSHAHWAYDRRRAAGLRAATGDLVAMTEDHAIPDPDWCAQIVRAHRSPHAAIGGSIDHVGSGVLNWAVYFCDFGRYQKPFTAAAAEYISDVNVSYKRDALMKCSALWQEFYHETSIHSCLIARGDTLWKTPQISVAYDRGRLRLSTLLPERFHWARVFAGRRAQSMTAAVRFVYAVASPVLPVVLLARKFREALRSRESLAAFVTSAPSMLLLLAVWACGEMTGYATAEPFGERERAVRLRDDVSSTAA